MFIAVVKLQHTCRCSSTLYRMLLTFFVRQQLYCRYTCWWLN